MVLVSDPETVRRVYAAPEESLSGGASSTVLEPFVGPSSILLTTGATHLRQRRLTLAPFHGERMESHREASLRSPRRSSTAGFPAGRCAPIRACRS
jgi:cytochrome P450